jgi:nitroreductase
VELREAIGRRRSIRFLRPYKPVEREKIQMMFEAARIASHWGNVQSLRGVAVFRDSAAPEVRDEIQAILLGWQLKIAPVVIVWYVQPSCSAGSSRSRPSSSSGTSSRRPSTSRAIACAR